MKTGDSVAKFAGTSLGFETGFDVPFIAAGFLDPVRGITARTDRKQGGVVESLSEVTRLDQAALVGEGKDLGRILDLQRLEDAPLAVLEAERSVHAVVVSGHVIVDSIVLICEVRVKTHDFGQALECRADPCT